MSHRGKRIDRSKSIDSTEEFLRLVAVLIVKNIIVLK